MNQAGTSSGDHIIAEHIAEPSNGLLNVKALFS